MFPNPFYLIILHTSTNSKENYVVASYLPSEEKDEGMDRETGAEITLERLSSMRFTSFQTNFISAIPLENKKHRISTFGFRVHNITLPSSLKNYK